MLTFSSTNSFQSDNRAPDFSKSVLRGSHNNSTGRTHDHCSLEFDDTDNSPVDDETASSGANAGEHGHYRVDGPNTSRRRRLPLASLRSTQSEEVFPSQASQRFPGFQNPRADAELLKPEGKIPGQTMPLISPLKCLILISARDGLFTRVDAGELRADYAPGSR